MASADATLARYRAADDADAALPTPGPSRPAPWRRALGPYARPPRRWGDRQVFFATMSFVALLYAGLYHPYWARGGDSELYLVIARNLVRGKGYTYNGQPVGLVPPLWPLVLGLMMWVTPVVGVLKLALPLCFLIFLGCAYRVLRRFARPWVCAASIALTASFQGLVTLTLWFHSDALFFALSWVALLLAVQSQEHFDAGEKRWPWLWRAVAATGLLCAAVATRWPGVLWWPVVAMAFLNGRHFFLPTGDRRSVRLPLRPRRLDGMWLAALLSGAAVVLTFFALRHAIKVDPSQIDPRYDSFVTGNYDLINQYERPTIGTHVNRLLRGPEWLSVLYWNELGHSPGPVLGRPLMLYASRLAAVTVIPLAAAVWVGLRRRNWLWLGVGGAWLPVVATWPHAIDRYSGPVSPFLVCGTILGTVWLAKRFRTRLPYYVMAVPLAVCLLYNGGRYGLEVWARLDYFDRYEGGVQPSLNRIAAYLRQNQPATGGEVAVTRTGIKSADMDERMNKVRGVRRNLIFLSDTPAIDVPAVDVFSPGEDWFIPWSAARRVRYFVLMPKQRRYFVHLHDLPWHEPGVWRDGVNALRHLLRAGDLPPRDPATLVAAGDEDYQLYELQGGEVGLPIDVRRVDVGGWPAGVLVVPGLEDVRQLGRKRQLLPVPYD